MEAFCLIVAYYYVNDMSLAKVGVGIFSEVDSTSVYAALLLQDEVMVPVMLNVLGAIEHVYGKEGSTTSSTRPSDWPAP